MKRIPPTLAATSDEPTSSALKLWVVLARAYRSLLERARRDIEGRGLGMSEFAVLEALYHKGAMPLGMVSELILLTSGSTTYIADKLEKRGLLTRRAGQEDRRVVYAEITDAGRALIEGIFPGHAAAMRDVMNGLDPAEMRQAVALLKRLGKGAQLR
jgi:MarR family transcriptional regulator, 2-MHQ and catechol-resistance regulon repressor